MSEKCSPDDPRRCQGVTPHGQCEYPAIENGKYCNYHSHGASERKLQQKKVERYLIDYQELRQSYLRQNKDAGYLDLKDEINLTHAMIERRLSSIKTDADLQMAIPHYNQLIARLESMKISLMKLQQQLGLVLDKDSLRILANDWADILNEELVDQEGKEELMDRIIERLFVAVESAGKKAQNNE